MVFDVESVGLNGEGFAVGFVILESDGTFGEAHRATCRPDDAAGVYVICRPSGSGQDAMLAKAEMLDRQWVAHNCPFVGDEAVTFANPKPLRAWFWKHWQRFRSEGCLLWADCCYPVETTFLADCVRDHMPGDLADGRGDTRFNAPFPLCDVAMLRVAIGDADPTRNTTRHADDEPAHDPLNDARHSARELHTLLRILRRRQEVMLDMVRRGAFVPEESAR